MSFFYFDFIIVKNEVILRNIAFKLLRETLSCNYIERNFIMNYLQFMTGIDYKEDKIEEILELYMDTKITMEKFQLANQDLV